MTDSESAGLNSAALHGATWLVTAGFAITGLALISQIALGRVLTEDDFGVYAIAIAITALLQVMRDGGVRLWLLQSSPTEALGNARKGFWLAFAVSTMAGASIAALSPVIASAYGRPELLPLLLVVAISIPLNVYPVVSLALLQVQHRFRQSATIMIGGAVVQYSLAVGLAIAGFGALSFVIPLVPAAVFQTATSYISVRFLPTMRPHLPSVRAVFLQSRWALIGAAATAVLLRLDYAVLGLLVTTTTVGVYFFAYELSFRLVNVLASSLDRVVVPTVAQLTPSTARMEQWALRGHSVIGFVASPAMLLLAVVAEPIETILWAGRWSSAVAPIQVFSTILALELADRFAHMLLQSQGNYRPWIVTTSLRGIGIGVAAASAAATVGDSPTLIALLMTLYLGGSGLLAIRFNLNRVGVSVSAALGRLIVPHGMFALAAWVLILLQPLIPQQPAVVLVATTLMFVLIYVVLVRGPLRARFNEIEATLARLPGGTTIARILTPSSLLPS